MQMNGSLQRQGPAGGRDFSRSLRCPCRRTSPLCRLKNKGPLGETMEPRKTAQSAPRTKNSATKKSRWVIVVGDSLLRGMEAPI